MRLRAQDFYEVIVDEAEIKSEYSKFTSKNGLQLFLDVDIQA